MKKNNFAFYPAMLRVFPCLPAGRASLNISHFVFCIFLLPPWGGQRGAAQPTLGPTEFPLPNTKFERWYVWAPSLGPAGANQTYDFSNPYVFGIDTLRYEDATMTPFYPAHIGSTVASFQPSKDLDIMWYYKSDNNAFWISGATIMLKDSDKTTSSANYYPAFTDTLISTDYSYGHQETEIGAIRFINVYPLVDLQRINFKFIYADGYGTLLTPGKTFDDVLRVGYVEFKFDTVFYMNQPVDYFVDTLYYVKYFVKGIRHPVATAYTDAMWNISYIELINFIEPVTGCTDSSAINFNPLATEDDGSCQYCSQISFTISSDTGICSGNSVTLTATGGGTYLWSTGATSASITVSPDSTEVYSVFIKQTNSCWEQAAVEVEVFHTVEAGFWVNPYNLTTSDLLLFVNTSVNATEYFWDFDDSVNGTSTEMHPYHQYSSGGAKNVMLIASNPCSSDTFYYSFTVSSMQELSPANGFAILSNPSFSDLIIRFYLPHSSPVTITATDVVGRTYALFSTGTDAMESRQVRIPVADKNLAPGLYIIRLISDEGVYRGRWVRY